MPAPRRFIIDQPPMIGTDIGLWQTWLKVQFRKWNIDYPIVVDGIYGVGTRSATASMLYALGIAQAQLAHGVTPELRTKVRNRRLTAGERGRFTGRVGWRRRLRARYAKGGKVAAPIAKILQDSWGYHPGVHDGIDLICRANAPLYAICDARVLRADAGGWWAKGAPRDPAVRGRGDGIIVLECLVDVGPFRKGLRFCYGHAERPVVRVGDRVKAGERIGTAGLANAWHIHAMVNGRDDDRGVGDRDPRRFIDYAVKHG
ncbi:MAG: peptidoglycan DD-metalloendopeptidase family protein [Solirubrobacteraceae bacterium]